MVVAVRGERVPRFGVAENVTVSPETGFPSIMIIAVTLEVVLEPATKTVGVAEVVNVPEEIVIVVVWVRLFSVAVIVVDPIDAPGVKVTVAYP